MKKRQAEHGVSLGQPKEELHAADVGWNFMQLAAGRQEHCLLPVLLLPVLCSTIDVR
jgi:hypothetical protein